jgi:hypothetical protein
MRFHAFAFLSLLFQIGAYKSITNQSQVRHRHRRIFFYKAVPKGPDLWRGLVRAAPAKTKIA